VHRQRDRSPARVAVAATVLRVLLAVAVVESFVHYLDNTLRFEDYAGPDPSGLNVLIPQWLVPVSWFGFTAAGLVGYRRFRQDRWAEAAPWVGVYSASGLISVLHYLGVSPSDLSVFQNTFVVADVVLGSLVLAFAVWTSRQARVEAEGMAQTQPSGSKSTS